MPAVNSGSQSLLHLGALSVQCTVEISFDLFCNSNLKTVIPSEVSTFLSDQDNSRTPFLWMKIFTRDERQINV